MASSYDFNTHKHNFAVWTAARAVQRGFKSTDEIAKAIEKSGLRAFAESDTKPNQKDFDKFHDKCCNNIVSVLGIDETSYGRAAKIVAIYLKTSVIIPNKGNCAKCKVIHPPIDGVLLKNLMPKNKLYKTAWTKLSEEAYWDLVDVIKRDHKFDWTLEYYWELKVNLSN